MLRVRRPHVPLRSAVGVLALAFIAPVSWSGHARAVLTNPVRDVGAEAGLPTALTSYAMRVRDIDRDGLHDLLLVHHGGPTQLYANTGNGFALRHTFVDTLHDEIDRHDCAWGDVDRDGRRDLYCAKGAKMGTARKHNELWMQQPDGTFIDRAAAYGVLDRWGRGRRATFLDLNGDAYPDLFVGNKYPRKDQHPTPNRTFINVGGEHFRRENLGLTKERGALCVDVGDIDDDGRDDLLVCENDRLRLYLRSRGGFRDATRELGIPPRLAIWAQLVDLDGDRDLDLVSITGATLAVRLQTRTHRFRRPTKIAIDQGRGFAVGDIDDDGAFDIMLVQGCVDGINLDDALFLGDDDVSTWTPVEVPGDIPGCGDKAVTLDFDLDGADDFVVSNGGGQRGGDGIEGPDQLLTMGDWTASP